MAWKSVYTGVTHQRDVADGLGAFNPKGDDSRGGNLNGKGKDKSKTTDKGKQTSAQNGDERNKSDGCNDRGNYSHKKSECRQRQNMTPDMNESSGAPTSKLTAASVGAVHPANPCFGWSEGGWNF